MRVKLVVRDVHLVVRGVHFVVRGVHFGVCESAACETVCQVTKRLSLEHA